MAQFMQIKGDCAELIEQRVIKRVHIDNYNAALSKYFGCQTPILSKEVIFYASNSSGGSFYLTENEPRKREIHVSEDGTINRYTIRFPYLYFLFKFNKSALNAVHIFGRNQRLLNVTDDLYVIPFKNIYDDCKICLGDVKYDLNGSFAEKIEKTLASFYRSQFNSDLNSHYSGSQPEEIRKKVEEGAHPYKTWEEMTRSDENAENATKFSWKKYGPLNEILRGLGLSN